ncbi:glycoside-pentoside-hexuronide (GPH):cation symporter [Paucilactobacillus suebicus]|uniref:Na+ xyloside symporter related transporter n=1 Tax=Paucilactobacillus suebicus DSM 5007 = KCTC 3549 TaxID=1423807 RepID=A0A0R1W4C4_9LACO|nr:glycoside-pentoside-hexuronide (GPH):cation symporter [Paucilactobacillus suebicus]KRM12606.1 Na+ xyloside symporter related transporter [Paucilactobacillus suebicus DSM 5007 = KCTC 3549]
MDTNSKAQANGQTTISNIPFTTKDKVGYMFGDIGNNFTFATVTSFLMIFYTNVLGISAAIVGILFLVARIIDAFADLTVGRLVDNGPLLEEGRFRPWIRRMKYPLLLLSILLFLPWIKDLPMGVKTVYIFLTYIVWGILYSTVNIPYGSMASAISSSPSEKTSLSTFRSIGAGLGGATVSLLVPMFMYSKGSHQISAMRMFIIVAICATAGFVAYIILYRLSVERVRTNKAEKVPLSTVVKKLGQDKALIALALVDLLMCIGLFSNNAFIPYLFNDYFQNKTAMSIALICGTIVILILAPFSKKLYERFGRKEVTVAFLSFGFVMFAILFFLHTRNVVLFLIVTFLANLGLGMFNMMVWAFITDVIDNEQVQTGIREDGVVYGVNSFVRKVSQAIAGGMAGFILTFIGYQASTTGGAVQSETVINHIYQVAVGVPAVSYGLALACLFFFYPLNKKKVLDNAAYLKKVANEQAE